MRAFLHLCFNWWWSIAWSFVVAVVVSLPVIIISENVRTELYSFVAAWFLFGPPAIIMYWKADDA